MTETPAAPAPRPVPIAPLMVAACVCQVGVTLYLPSLPSMQVTFATSQAGVQATLAVYLLTFALAQIVVGPLSDRVGRRPVMLAGLLMFAASALVCAVAPTIGALIAARAVQGVGACCALVLSRAVVRDVATGGVAARANAMLSSAVALAPAASPLIGGQLEAHLDWRWGFHLMAGSAVLAALFIWRSLPETARGNRGAFFRGYGQVVRVRRFVGCAIGISAGTAMFYVFISSAPAVFITGTGMAPELFGFITMAWAGAFIFGAQLTARMQHRFGGWKMMIGGASLSAGGALCIAALAVWQGTPGYVPMLLLLVLIGIGNGLNLPNANAMGMSAIDATVAGTAAAALGILQFGWGGAVSLIAQSSALGMALLLALHAGIGVLAYALVATRPARG